MVGYGGFLFLEKGEEAAKEIERLEIAVDFSKLLTKLKNYDKNVNDDNLKLFIKYFLNMLYGGDIE
jgi:hypothetical protein